VQSLPSWIREQEASGQASQDQRTQGQRKTVPGNQRAGAPADVKADCRREDSQARGDQRKDEEKD